MGPRALGSQGFGPAAPDLFYSVDKDGSGTLEYEEIMSRLAELPASVRHDEPRRARLGVLMSGFEEAAELDLASMRTAIDTSGWQLPSSDADAVASALRAHLQLSGGKVIHLISTCFDDWNMQVSMRMWQRLTSVGREARAVCAWAHTPPPKKNGARHSTRRTWRGTHFPLAGLGPTLRHPPLPKPHPYPTACFPSLPPAPPIPVLRPTARQVKQGSTPSLNAVAFNRAMCRLGYHGQLHVLDALFRSLDTRRARQLGFSELWQLATGDRHTLDARNMPKIDATLAAGPGGGAPLDSLVWNFDVLRVLVVELCLRTGLKPVLLARMLGMGTGGLGKRDFVARAREVFFGHEHPDLWQSEVRAVAEDTFDAMERMKKGENFLHLIRIIRTRRRPLAQTPRA